MEICSLALIEQIRNTLLLGGFSSHYAVAVKSDRETIGVKRRKAFTVTQDSHTQQQKTHVL